MNLLDDLKILDFTTLLPGPYATWQLAEMGAKVTKISAPERLDLVLEMEPKTENGISANRAWMNNKKDEIFLDLKSKEGYDEIIRLIKEEGYNCIIEQFRPGTMAKFGLSYDEVKEFAPDLIYCSLSGYGQTGPYKDRAGHDINYLALSGIMSFSGRKEEGPVLYGTQIGDIASSLNAIIGILAAHSKRKENGEGIYIDIGILDSLTPLNSMLGAGAMLDNNNPTRQCHWLNGGGIYDFYETKDGRYLAVGSVEPKFFKVLLETLGHEDWLDEGVSIESSGEYKEIIKADIKEKTFDQWVEIFAKEDACVEPVLTVTEALVDSENAKEREQTAKVAIEDDEILTYQNPIKFRK